MKQHVRSLVLPLAIVMGLLLHGVCGLFYRVVPALVFTMLFLSYTALDVRKMHMSMMHLWLLLFQAGLSVAVYWVALLAGAPEALAEGLLLGSLTPVAASVVVIACALGADRETVTTFTMLDNLMVAVMAPVVFSFVGEQQGLPFVESFWKIFCRIAPQIVFPFLAALLLQRVLPRVNDAFMRIKGCSLYVWAVALTIVLGKTFDDIMSTPERPWAMLGAMLLLAVVLCGVQFGVGRRIGERYGPNMAGGQLLGQKNTSFGIWLAVEYLNPMAGVFPAIYSVCQNIYNSYQMFQHDRRQINDNNHNSMTQR